MSEPENTPPTPPEDEKPVDRVPARGRKPRKSRIPLDDQDPPLFAEKCDFCDCFWASNVKFHNVLVKGYKPIHRACQFCRKIMEEGPNGCLAPRRVEAVEPGVPEEAPEPPPAG